MSCSYAVLIVEGGKKYVLARRILREKCVKAGIGPGHKIRAVYNGSMHVDESILSEVVRRVLTVSLPDRIILFGSAASGQMNRDSDLDLLVIEQAPENTRDRSVRIRRALGDVNYPVDVIVMATDRFESTKGVIGGIAYPANKYGRILYEAA